MGANSDADTYSDSNANTYAYSHSDTYSDSHTYSYSHTHTISFFYHNVDPAYNVDGDPFDYFGQNDQFISTINFINADHHILNHYNRTMSF